jgi:hypothetical protein
MQFNLKSKIKVNNISRTATIETKLLMSLRCKGVSIKVYDKYNNLINEFPTIISTAQYFGLLNRTIGYYLDKNKSYKGFTFKSTFKNN